MLRQLHKIGRYRPVMVSTVIILTANMLERKMQRLCREMEEKKEKIFNFGIFRTLSTVASKDKFSTYLKQHTVLRGAAAYSVYRKQ